MINQPNPILSRQTANRKERSGVLKGKHLTLIFKTEISQRSTQTKENDSIDNFESLKVTTLYRI
jgi:hypothetical protein